MLQETVAGKIVPKRAPNLHEGLFHPFFQKTCFEYLNWLIPPSACFTNGASDASHELGSLEETRSIQHPMPSCKCGSVCSYPPVDSHLLPGRGVHFQCAYVEHLKDVACYAAMRKTRPFKGAHWVYSQRPAFASEEQARKAPPLAVRGILLPWQHWTAEGVPSSPSSERNP